MDDRYLAYKILSKIEYDKAYSNIAVDTVLNSNEAASAPFVCAIVYGVIERKITLDYILSQYLTQPLRKLNPQVLTVLRMGVYQIKYMEKVPDSAAVNESVKLVRKVKCSFASGLVNSVLRKVCAHDVVFPQTDNICANLSVRYSCPERLVQSYIDDYGVQDTEQFLKASLGAPPVILRVNTLKTDSDSIIKLLADEGIVAEKTEIENALILKNGGAVSKTKCYSKGLFHVQDTASQICIKELNPQPGETVFDMCASP
ncbi:MAG: transcription antitermination factor NusB, partial [Candidatus Fimenecus sp.]